MIYTSMHDYTNFLYTKQLEQATDQIKEDFFRVYGAVDNLKIIKSPKQDQGVSAEWVGSFAYFQKRKPQWDSFCESRSVFLKPFVESFPQDHLLGIWFSAILPGGIIRWHIDKYDQGEDYVRVHLPLIVPEGDIGITVEDTTYKWEQGKVFCFNPFVMHTAWNKTNALRLNLNFNFSKNSFL